MPAQLLQLNTIMLPRIINRSDSAVENFYDDDLVIEMYITTSRGIN